MILTGLTKYRDLGLLMLRVGLGAAFILHGWPKIMQHGITWKGLGSVFPIGPAVVWGFIGSVIEFGGGILLILGAFFRPVCILLVGQMLVAIFCMHIEILHQGFYGTHNGSSVIPGYAEALEDGIVFLSLILIGPGKYSIDRK